MTSFSKKKIAPPKRVCLRLKELRAEAGVSLASLAQKTKIDKKYLKALEECQFDDLPDGNIYRKNIIKKYANAIGQNPKLFAIQFDSEECTPTPTAHPKSGVHSLYFQNLPSFLKYIIVTCIVILFLVYLGSQVKNIMEPPLLVIQEPRNGLVTAKSAMPIKGKTNPEVFITINGQEIMSNDKGEFEQLVDLSPGINELTISVKKKHGKTTSETRYVILKQQDSISDLRIKNLSALTQ